MCGSTWALHSPGVCDSAWPVRILFDTAETHVPNALTWSFPMWAERMLCTAGVCCHQFWSDVRTAVIIYQWNKREHLRSFYSRCKIRETNSYKLTQQTHTLFKTTRHVSNNSLNSTRMFLIIMSVYLWHGYISFYYPCPWSVHGFVKKSLVWGHIRVLQA